MQLEQKRRLLKKTEVTNKREHKTEVTNKREHKVLHLNIETDFRRSQKDDVQRLELQLSWVKVYSQGSQLNLHSKNLQIGNTKKLETEGELIARIFSRLGNKEEYCSDRNCLI